MLIWKVNKEFFSLGLHLISLNIFVLWVRMYLCSEAWLFIQPTHQKQDLSGRVSVLQESQPPSGHLPRFWVGVMARTSLGRSILGGWRSREFSLTSCVLAMGAFLWKYPCPCPSWVATQPLRPQPLPSGIHNMAFCGKCKAAVYELFTHCWSDI